MTTAFGWLAELFGFLGSLVPQYFHMELTDVAVSISRGSRVTVLSPGIHWYWPFWTKIYYRAANVQTVNLPSQAIETRDEKRVVVGGMVRYRLERTPKEVMLALVETDDVDRVIVDESLAVFCEYVSGQVVGEIQANRRAVNTAITEAVRRRLELYGVKVLRAQLTDFCRCTTINLVTAGGTGVLSHEEE